jgi:tetratricopeptide (TPR) repeat protein
VASGRSPDQVERLAHHALRGEVWDKALEYFRQAGEKAMARSAHREAVGYFEQALSAIVHLPEQRHTLEQAIDLRLALRSALWPSGDLGRILAYLREAETLAEALALATASGEVVLQAQANQRLGQAYQAQGDYRRAIDCLRQSVAGFDGVQRREHFGQVILPAVLSRAYLAWCHAELGTFAEGRTLGDERLRIAEEVAHTGSLMYAYHGIGLLALRQGDLPRALPLLERAIGICQDADLPLYFPWIAAALGAAYALAGRGADAVPLLTQALEQATATVVHQALCRLSLGEGLGTRARQAMQSLPSYMGSPQILHPGRHLFHAKSERTLHQGMIVGIMGNSRIGWHHRLRFHHICAVAGELTTLESRRHVTLVDQPPTRTVDEIRPGLHQRQACRIDESPVLI